MATLLERIQKIRTNADLSATEKVKKLKAIYENYKINRLELIEALADLEIPMNVPQQLHEENVSALHSAAFIIEDIAKNNPELILIGLDAIRKIKQQIEEKAPVNIKAKDSTFYIMASLANSSNESGVAVHTAKLISETKSYKGGFDAICRLTTDPTDVIGMCAIFEAEAERTKEQGDNYYDHNLRFNEHEHAVVAISNLAMAERHPERVNDVFASLQAIGTKRAAFAIAKVMQNHFLHRVRERPEGKRGNLRYNSAVHHLYAYRDITLNSDGFKALISIGDMAVPALYKLSSTWAYNSDPAKRTYKDLDEKSARSVITALAEINTPSALKAIAQIAFDNPKVEEYALDTLQDIKSADSAKALTFFGAGTHYSVSEAFSDRANKAFGKILSMYESKNWYDIPADDLKGIKEAAASLSKAITSDNNLRRRFVVGNRHIRDTSNEVMAWSQYIGEKENDRIPVKRTKKDIRREVEELKMMFKEAIKIGLLDEEDMSLPALKAFTKYNNIQRKHNALS